MRNKRAQSSLYVILGIILLVILVVFFISKQINQKNQIKEDLKKIESFSEIRGKVSTYTNLCLKYLTEEIVNNIWIGEEEDIYEYIDKNFLECVDDFNAIEKQGYDISFDDFEHEVDIKDGYINVEMYFPITITRDNQETYLESFEYNMYHENNPDFDGIDNMIFDFTDVHDFDMVFENVAYKKMEVSDPALLTVYVVKINLYDQDLEFEVTPPKDKEGVRTNFMQTSAFLNMFDLQVAINGDGWKRETDNSLMGLAAWHSDIYGSPESGEPTIFFSEDEEVIFLKRPNRIWDAVSGFSVIVKDGEITPNTIGEDRREPRTSVGLDEEKNVLIFIIVDGRQKGYSVGIGLENLAKLQLDHGASIALNMDGGGSSTVAIQGKYDEGVENSPVVNSPSDEVEFVQICPGEWDNGDCVDQDNNPIETVDGDAIPYSGQERTVANHLGLRAKAWILN